MRWYEGVGLAKDSYDVYGIGGVLGVLGLIAFVLFGKPISEAAGNWLYEKARALGVLIAIAMVLGIIYWVSEIWS